jgi:HAE1 family hydrophobic/amphiphilic exporter-1
VPTVVLEVRRQLGSNTIEVIDPVKAEHGARPGELPPASDLKSSAISRATSRPRCTRFDNHLLLGSVLACLGRLCLHAQLAVDGDRRR